MKGVVEGWTGDGGVLRKGNVVISDFCGTFMLKVDGNEMGSYSCLEMAMEDADEYITTALVVMEDICQTG